MKFNRLADLADRPFRPTDEKQLPAEVAKSLQGSKILSPPVDLAGLGPAVKPTGRSALTSLGLKFSHTPQPEPPIQEKPKQEHAEKTNGGPKTLSAPSRVESALSMKSALQALCKTNLTSRGVRVFLSIILGGKITPAQCAEATGLSLANTYRTLKILRQQKAVLQDADGFYQVSDWQRQANTKSDGTDAEAAVNEEDRMPESAPERREGDEGSCKVT